jgi:glycosyltransferase involved in cell wall biosynthesis
MQWLLLILIIPYLYLLLKIYSGLVKIKPFSDGTSAGLFVSVVVACHNEERNLPFILQDLSQQEYNPDLFEIIIVDDDSSDGTFKCASGFKAIKNLHAIKNSGTGKKQAIRTGISASSGKVIITTDADCRIGKKWLSSIASFITENKPDMVICPVKLAGGRGFCSHFQELEFLSLQGITAGTAVAGNPVMCNGANLAFAKESYIRNLDYLHFELVSGDDVFLLHGIKKDPQKKILWLESEGAIVTTASPGAITSFLKQRARWISKAGHYTDRYTQLLAIVTFVTILLQAFLLVAGIFNPVFFLIFLSAFAIKSIPDFLILRNTVSRYGKSSLMRWFFPSQIIYPFYLLLVIPMALYKGNRWN